MVLEVAVRTSFHKDHPKTRSRRISSGIAFWGANSSPRKHPLQRPVRRRPDASATASNTGQLAPGSRPPAAGSNIGTQTAKCASTGRVEDVLTCLHPERRRSALFLGPLFRPVSCPLSARSVFQSFYSRTRLRVSRNGQAETRCDCARRRISATSANTSHSSPS